jgi:hypothetical protein
MEALARAERAEAALRRIIELDDERGWERRRTITLNRLIEDARAALAATTEEERDGGGPRILHTLSGSICSECGTNQNHGYHADGCSAATTEEDG